MSTQTARRDATVQALVEGMARGRGRRACAPRGKAAARPKLSERDRLLRAAWLRGQINARHGWTRRLPRAWLLAVPYDLERNRFFYAGYDAMIRQRRSGRGVTLMPVADPQWVASLHLIRPASDRMPAAVLER